jgi:hypothetical protein
MATAKQIRDVMLRSADGAARDCPDDLDMRARVFVARLCGSMTAHGEAVIECALNRVLGIDAERPPADGA